MALGMALIQRQKKNPEPEFFHKLLADYRNNDLSRNDYTELLKECIEQIEVFGDFMKIKTTCGEITLTRRVVLRQKGFSRNKLSRLRKNILSALEK